MNNLEYIVGTGSDNYSACVIAPATAGGKTRGDFDSPILRCLGQTEAVPASGVSFTVHEGSSTLMGALVGPQGKVPRGVKLSVYAPGSATPLPSTTIHSKGDIAIYDDNTMICFCVPVPAAGDWKIQVQSSDDSVEFLAFVSTTPTSGGSGARKSTLRGMLDQEALAEYEKSASSVSGECLLCTLGTIALAAIIIAVIAAGIFMLGPMSTPVIATASFIYDVATTTVSTAQAGATLNLLVGLGSGVNFATSAIITAICVFRRC